MTTQTIVAMYVGEGFSTGRWNGHKNTAFIYMNTYTGYVSPHPQLSAESRSRIYLIAAFMGAAAAAWEAVPGWGIPEMSRTAGSTKQQLLMQ